MILCLVKYSQREWTGTLVLVGDQAEAKGKMVYTIFLGICEGEII